MGQERSDDTASPSKKVSSKPSAIRPHPARQEGQPFLGLPLGIFCQKIGKRGLEGLGSENQSGLLGGFVAFVHVAAIAGGDKVGPDRLASLGLGDDMIYRQMAFAAAVLALPVVPLEDIGAVEQNPAEWNAFVVVQADHGWVGKTSADGTDLQEFVGGEHVGFLQKTEHDGLVDRHDRHRRMIQVQYQNALFHSLISQ